MFRKFFPFLLLLSCTLFYCETQPDPLASTASGSGSYDDLVELYKEWREFERPPLLDGAPDYTATTFAKRWPEFKAIQAKLTAMDTTNWPINQQVDWHVVWAEMNGYDFNHNILKPWLEIRPITNLFGQQEVMCLHTKVQLIT